jgi:hypothetical protein
VFSFCSRAEEGAVAVIEFVEDDHLRIAIFDSMRGVKLPTLKRALTEEALNLGILDRWQT